MAKTVPVKDLRRDLGPLLDAVSDRREHIVVTRHGRPAAVIIPHDEYTALEETAEVLSDASTMTALESGLAADPAQDVPLESLRAEIARRRG
ncbi:MAG: type II toxin-antitoxin system Phd/YefM family antitoxin [Sporichthyaceae bacterium]